MKSFNIVSKKIYSLLFEAPIDTGIWQNRSSYNRVLYEGGTRTLSESIRILILGSGFAGIEALKSLQKAFHKDNTVEIVLVSKDNFLLFTPMLPEVATGMIETRHILTPVRSFCKKSQFFQAEVESIDLEKRMIFIKHSIGRQSQPSSSHTHTINYDFLIVALGSEPNFFGISEIEKHSFTMKDIDDAITLRNHVINILEQANLEHEDENLCDALLTFVVVGGGFNGIETVGALNDFIRGTIKKYYKKINPGNVKIILVDAGKKILEQIDEDLGDYALKRLEEKGVTFKLNTQVKEVTEDSILMNDGTSIASYTVIWTTGVAPSKLIATLKCEHDNQNRIKANEYLELLGYEGSAYAVGDCASIINPITGKSHPPTAQHAIRQGKLAANNIIFEIKGKGSKKQLDYKTRGMIAEIGRRDGVATLFGIKLHGFIAWCMWRTFYLLNLPTRSKRLKVFLDWTMDLFFKPDVSYFTFPQRRKYFKRRAKVRKE